MLQAHSQNNESYREGFSDSNLQNAFYQYINSQPEEVWKLIKQTGSKIECSLVPNEQQEGWRLDGDLLKVNVQSETARTVLAKSWAFRWGNGILTVPTIMGLLDSGIIDLIADDGESPTIDEIARHLIKDNPEKNLGNIWGALHLIELQGWARHTGKDENSRFYLTRSGQLAIKLIRDNQPVCDTLFNEIGIMKDYHSLCHSHSVDPASLTRLQSFIDQSRRQWSFTLNRLDAVESQVVNQLVNCLDGLLTGCLSVALGMPVYKEENDRIVESAPSVYSRFGNDNEWISWEQATENINQDFFELAAQWMENHRITETDDKHRLRLTPQGLLHTRITPALAALGVSYLRSYQHIGELLTGNPDPCDIEHDRHVDRVMNVYGSSGAGSGPASKIITENIIRHLFDELPRHA